MLQQQLYTTFREKSTLHPWAHVMMRVFALLLIMGSTSCGGGSTSPSMAASGFVPISIALHVPGQLVAETERGLLESVFDIAIGDAHAAILLLGVQSISVNISGPGFATITDIFNTTPGTLVTRSFDVPFGVNRKIIINGFDAPIGAGGVITHTGTAVVTLAATAPGATAVPIVVNVPISISATLDSDGDGVTDVAEIAFGSNPAVAEADHDGDLIFTRTELALNRDPLLAGSKPVSAALLGQTDSLGVLPANALANAGGNGDTSFYGLSIPHAIAIDAGGNRLFVADSDNNRIVVYALNATNNIASRKAIFVLGQSSFEFNQPNRGGVATAATLNRPSGVAYVNDTANAKKWLVVTDSANNRILIYDITAGITNGMAAVKVLAQTNMVRSASGLTSATVNNPNSVRVMTFNAASLLVVCDSSNNRALLWDISTGGIGGLTNGQAAGFVLGQAVFTSSAAAPITSASLQAPSGLAQWNNFLLISDHLNHRVLAYDLGINAGNLIDGMAALNVIGQTTMNAGLAGINASRLNAPYEIELLGNLLFVADHNNVRVLVFDLAGMVNGMAAAFVYGQVDMASKLQKLAQGGFGGTYGLAIASNALLVSDDWDDEIMEFDLTNLVATQIPAGVGAFGPLALNGIGQTTTAPGMVDGLEAVVWNAGGTNDTGATSFSSPQDAVLGIVLGVSYLFVADTLNDRVLAFKASAAGIPLDMQADFVFGQVDYDHSGGNLTQWGLSKPGGVAFDSATSTLYVSDTGYNRVLSYDLALGMATNGVNGVGAAVILATQRLGQINFFSGAVNLSSTALNQPKRMAIGTLAGVAYLFVTDSGNDRVLAFDISTPLLGNDAATFVLGAADFVSNAAGASLSQLVTPTGIDFDPVSKRLFVSSANADRVLIWDLSNALTPITNGMAASWMLGQTNAALATGNNPVVVNQWQFNAANDVAFDAIRKVLWVSDVNNRRFLGFAIANGIATGMNASYVIGQADYVSKLPYTADSNRTAFTTAGPSGLSVGPQGHLIVVDDVDDRVLLINP